MEFDGWLLLIHIASAGVWLGAGVTLSLLGVRARRQGTLFAFVQQMEWIGPRIGSVVSIGVVGTGVWMVLRNTQFGFTDPWILGGIVGFVVLLALGVGFHNRQYERIRTAAEEFGEASQPVMKLIGASILGAQVEVVVLLGIVGLMVLRPGM